MIGEQPITVGDLVQTCIAEYVHFSTIDEPAPIGDHIGRRPKFLVRITILIQGQFVQSENVTLFVINLFGTATFQKQNSKYQQQGIKKCFINASYPN